MKSAIKRAAALSVLAVPMFLTACGAGPTVDYLYVTAAGAATGGTVFGFAVDGDSGYITGSGELLYPSGGINAQGSAATSDAKWLYVMNRDDDTIVEFGVRVGQGTITPLNTYNTNGTQPSAIQRDSANQYLYVVDKLACTTLTNCYSSTNPGVGDLSVFSIADATGALTPVNAIGTLFVGNSPTGVAVTPASSSGEQFIYVANSADGTISAISQNGTTLAAIATTAIGVGGAQPYAVYASATTLYVTDYANNAIYWYTINADGSLPATPTGSSSTDVGPNYIAVDPTGKFLYTSNYIAGDISAYTINSNGSLTNSGATYGTGANPRWIAISPQGGPFLYTANYIDNSVSGFLINSDGSLGSLQRFPIAVNGTHISSVSIVPQTPPSTSSSN